MHHQVTTQRFLEESGHVLRIFLFLLAFWHMYLIQNSFATTLTGGKIYCELITRVWTLTLYRKYYLQTNCSDARFLFVAHTGRRTKNRYSWNSEKGSTVLNNWKSTDQIDQFPRLKISIGTKDLSLNHLDQNWFYRSSDFLTFPCQVAYLKGLYRKKAVVGRSTILKQKKSASIQMDGSHSTHCHISIPQPFIAEYESSSSHYSGKLESLRISFWRNIEHTVILF